MDKVCLGQNHNVLFCPKVRSPDLRSGLGDLWKFDPRFMSVEVLLLPNVPHLPCREKDVDNFTIFYILSTYRWIHTQVVRLRITLYVWRVHYECITSVILRRIKFKVIVNDSLCPSYWRYTMYTSLVKYQDFGISLKILFLQKDNVSGVRTKWYLFLSLTSIDSTSVVRTHSPSTFMFNYFQSQSPLHGLLVIVVGSDPVFSSSHYLLWGSLLTKTLHVLEIQM